MSPSLFAPHKPSLTGRTLPRFGERMRGVLSRVVGIIALAAFAAGLGWVGWRLYAFVFESDFFKVAELKVELAASAHLPDAPGVLERQVRNRLRDRGAERANLLTLDSEEIEATLADMPWVREARVEKDYPDRLRVVVCPRRIEALVLHDPILAVDAQGVVVCALTTGRDMAADYPYVTGLDVSQADLGAALDSPSLTRAIELLCCLRGGEPLLYSSVSEVHCDGEGNLALVLEGGTRVRFGTGDPVRKMPHLETFIARKGRPENYAYIDLRFDGQVPYKRKR